MSWVQQRGLQEAIKTATALQYMLGTAAKVSLDIPDEEQDKLLWQALMKRNVTNIADGEKREVRAIVKEHVEAARDSGGRISGGQREWRAMHTELGEWMRDMIADKIEDKRAVYKAPLSRRYAAWKLAHYGAKPILVLTGALLRAIRNARVKVSKR